MTALPEPPAQALRFAAADRTALAGTLYEPSGPLKKTVLLAGGPGIAQRFYAPFVG